MKGLLFDMHAFYWLVVGDVRLSVVARSAIVAVRGALFVSLVSAYEFGVHAQRGKLVPSVPFWQWFIGSAVHYGISVVPISVEAAPDVPFLPIQPGDPWDRIIVSTALYRSLDLVTVDGFITQARVLGLKVVW